MRNKILFITAFLPNEAAAGEKNSMLMIKDLSLHYDVDLVYYMYDYQEKYKPDNEHIKVLRVFRNSTFVKLRNVLMTPQFFPIFTIRYTKTNQRWLQTIVDKNKYDAIVFEHSQMLLYAKRLKTNSLKILFSQDVMYQRISRAKGKLAAKWCKWTEAYCHNTSNSVAFAISAKDADLLSKLYGLKAQYSVAYIDNKIIDSFPSKINNEFVFIGKWSRADNLDGVIWFFEKVTPLIKNKIKVTILGKNFPIEKINNKNPLIELSIPGFVENPYPMIANCKAMLSPLFSGAGVKQKVLESLACGTPVIGTKIAFEGISAEYKDFMLLAENPESFAKSITDINLSVQERTSMKKYFLDNYSKSTITNYLKNIIN